MEKPAWRHKEAALDLIYDTGGGILYAAGLHIFATSGAFSTGGISGLALMLNHLFGFPLGITTLVFNIPVILLSFRVVGKRFLLKSLRSMVVCTLFLDGVFPWLGVYQGLPLLCALYAGALLGAGLALFYLRGSSSGGTDFITISIKTLHPHLSIGMVTMSIDLVVILLGWPVFGNPDAVLYGLISTTTCSLVIDKIMYGAGAGKLVLVITGRGQAVAARISQRCGRGSTIAQAVGAYTGRARQVILCACSRAEAVRVRAAVWEEDPDAFVMITETSEVFGEGFLPANQSAP